MSGIDASLKVFDELGVLAVDGIVLVKEFKGGWGAVFKLAAELVPIIKAAQGLMVDAPKALPELADLDAPECAQLGAAAYVLVKKVIGAVQQ